MLNYRWKLSDGFKVASPALRCFGTFTCGGGSAMGYKLAGFDYLGGVELDPEVAKVYNKNLKPKYLFNEDINEFNKRDSIPDELYDLDILDGSPPCSAFSMASRDGRENVWGKKKHFKEGQKKQVLDDLVFSYVETIKKLQPKTFILENVKGMISGNAKSYCKRIIDKLSESSYKVQIYLLDSSTMGVPQSRERVFFIGRRKNLKLGDLRLKFEQRPICFEEISDDDDKKEKITEKYLGYWNESKEGTSMGLFKSLKKCNSKRPAFTINATVRHFHPKYKRRLNDRETILAGSFPLDYDFMDCDVNYLIGMSVPPLMTAGVASEIAKQWFGVKYGEI